MNKHIAASILTASMMLTAPAFAQATRTWVSGVGDDANPCSRTAPCKTFAGAISKTAADGEINVIDPGGFGTITITKSITIDGYGPQSSILAFNTNGVIINGAGIVVTLRNLSINGAGTTSGAGVRIISAGSVNLENLRIANFAGTAGTAGRGVSVETGTPGVRVAVKNSQFHNLRIAGIASLPAAGSVDLDVDGVSITGGGGDGIRVRNDTKLTVSRSMISGNADGTAVLVERTNSSGHISDSTLANNETGVKVGAGGQTPVVRLFGTVVTGNTLDGLKINSGSILSHGNNAIRGNAGNETATPPALGTQ